ncbi:hypothetical protein PIB30_030747 [Stylosanthes scabra]|uniref:Uncharacterized protein n=1 Tax=Stylosanthes scabra TaxID=79078 RepID=A0ABU6XBV9_9FABA|nr:hypothetical protein [Stylosanthes scabra]
MSRQRTSTQSRLQALISSLDDEDKNRTPRDPNTIKNRYAEDSFKKFYYNKSLHYEGQLAEDDQICQFVEEGSDDYEALTSTPVERVPWDAILEKICESNSSWDWNGSKRFESEPADEGIHNMTLFDL